MLARGLVLAGCGGGGGSSGRHRGGQYFQRQLVREDSGGTTGTTYVPGQYLAASQYAAKCANPRSGTDPDDRYALPGCAGYRDR